jgi:hypothetical protein
MSISQSQLAVVEDLAADLFALEVGLASRGARAQASPDPLTEEKKAALASAKDAAGSLSLRQLLCPSLRTTADDLREVAKVVGAAMLPLSFVPGTQFALTPLVAAAVAVVVFRAGTAAFCRGCRNDD